jgi:hypothetical protein
MSVLWEYKTFVARGGMALTDQRLNDLGREGWELIAFDLNPAGNLTYIFMRERNDSSPSVGAGSSAGRFPRT